MSVQRGFETEGLAAMWVQPTRDTYRNRDQFSQAMRARLEQIPGVRAAAMNHLPLSGLSAGTNFYLDRGGEDEQINAILSIGQDNYFDVMGVPIVAGRGFKPGDTRKAPRIAVVNQTLARRCWPDGNAIGQRFRTGDDPKAWIEVVGIADDIRHKELAAPIEPMVHLPATQAEREINEWVLRFRGNPAQVLQRAREVVAGVSPLPVSRTLILEDAIGLSVAIPRFRTYFIVGLAGLAAVLALLGMYGVLAFSVAQRTREIGVRMALGAQADEVVRAVIGSGMKLALVGAGIGLAVAWSGAGLLSAFLFDVAPRHVATYAGAVAGVLVISCVAAYLPARRAAGVNPVSALKDE
jgi:predicted permease